MLVLVFLEGKGGCVFFFLLVCFVFLKSPWYLSFPKEQNLTTWALTSLSLNWTSSVTRVISPSHEANTHRISWSGRDTSILKAIPPPQKSLAFPSYIKTIILASNFSERQLQCLPTFLLQLSSPCPPSFSPAGNRISPKAWPFFTALLRVCTQHYFINSL